MGVSDRVLESLQSPLETQQVAESVAEIACQIGIQPNVHTKWPATGELYRAEEDFRCQASSQEPVRDCPVTPTRELVTTILEWREKGPLDLDDFGDWRYQTAVRSQNLEGLPERFDRLSLGSLGQSCQLESMRVPLSQLTLTIPPLWEQIVTAMTWAASPPPTFVGAVHPRTTLESTEAPKSH